MDVYKRLEILEKQEPLMEKQLQNTKNILALGKQLESDKDNKEINDKIDKLENENEKLRKEVMQLMENW